MKTTSAAVAIVISHNNVDVIDRTIESLRRQTLPRQQCYIVAVDFGSTDGTYEKLLSYDRYHMGVYQVAKDIRPEQYLAKAAKFVMRLSTNHVKYYFWLRAGDTVAPEISEYCLELIEKYRIKSPMMVISEADVENEDGSITKVPPLFNEAFMLDGNLHPMEFLKRGYNHRVFCIGGFLCNDDSYRNSIVSETTRWNNLFYLNFIRNSIYIPNTMAVLRDYLGTDAVFTIASNYSILLGYIRHLPNIYNDMSSKNDYALAFRNLSYSALYRACLEFGLNNTKTAEDCLLFSSVIAPDIIHDRIYAATSAYIFGKGPAPIWEPEVTLAPPPGSMIVAI